eukprot:CAMPEP_0113577816 /NCGR_PEP_ID=MMETSP0015_2-20120614/29098_1 /TAXON_ID=2838 /ORGANISM="Odontella" /LENGTH=75 /DNA_ID=CAMNT_0000481477 /DNA_START=139 /DNA_END=366 /DNA_ORIENTATION=+ /assembly_acc=CAM_ASM_000160
MKEGILGHGSLAGRNSIQKIAGAPGLINTWLDPQNSRDDAACMEGDVTYLDGDALDGLVIPWLPHLKYEADHVVP